ncbi:MAG: hypothetical protein IPO56_15890 [Flavobacteriales bacterium]|nr:hypothetical protein [Flavobacteriales bacterium]
MRPTLLPSLFALAGLLPFSLNAQSTVRTINDGFETAFGSEGEMTLLTDGDVLVQDGHTVMRLHPDGTVAWMRNYRFGEEAAIIGDIGEELAGDLIMRIAVYDPSLNTYLGWMRTNSMGVPVECKVRTDVANFAVTAQLAVHSNGDRSMYYFDLVNATETLCRLAPNGTLLWAKQPNEGAGILASMDIEAWGTDLYMASIARIHKFDANGNELWAQVYHLGLEIEKLRPRLEGVYFAGKYMGEPAYGLFDHDGALLWARSIVCSDPIFLEDPNVSEVDVVHGPAGDLVYVKLGAEDLSFLFHIGIGPVHEALGGARIPMSHAPDRIAPTALGGAALTYSSSPGSISLVHTVDPTLDPTGCADAVAFTTEPITPNAMDWPAIDHHTVTPQWEVRTIITENVNGSTTTLCNGVGLPELEVTRPHVYPQPATDRVQIMELPAGPIQYSVFDATGRAVQHGTGSGPMLSLSLGELEPGVAVVHVHTAVGSWKFPVLMQ